VADSVLIDVQWLREVVNDHLTSEDLKIESHRAINRLLDNATRVQASQFITVSGDVTPEQIKKLQEANKSEVSRAVLLDSDSVEVRRLNEALDFAWGVIANASGGDWDKEPAEWKQAAERFRDDYYKTPTMNEAPSPPRKDEWVSDPFKKLDEADMNSRIATTMRETLLDHIAHPAYRISDVDRLRPENVAKFGEVVDEASLSNTPLTVANLQEAQRMMYDNGIENSGYAPSPMLSEYDLSWRSTRQYVVGKWAEEAFGGAEANSVPQRALRVLEEAIELAQAAKLDEKLVHDLVKYVYQRPVGEVEQEVSGVSVTLLAFCCAAGLNADTVEWAEVVRVLSKPREFFTERNAKKNAAGFLVVK
jgi:hypothetical protein